MKKKFVLLMGSLCVASASPAFADIQTADSAISANAPVYAGKNAAVEGGRTLQVLVAQSEIKSNMNPSNIAMATGGGLLGGIIGAVVDSNRAKKAEELIAPIRTAMTGYDADGVAIETAKAAFANSQWFPAGSEVLFSKDSSKLGKNDMIDKSATKQVAFVEYSYDLSPDFDALRLVMRIDIANKAIPAKAKGKAEKRLDSKYLDFSRTITSVIMLPSFSGEKEVNAQRWAENDAEMVRKALVLAFKNTADLTTRTLALSPEEAKAMDDKKNKKIVAGGFSGRPQPVNGDYTLLWDKNFIHVQTLQ